MIATNSSDRHPVDQLAEDFVARYRKGERPSIAEYVEKYPEIASEVVELIQALLLMEELGPAQSTPTLHAGLGSVDMPERLGEYRLLREVGRGGMGIVYEAVQESLCRRVALKVLPAPGVLHRTHLERFRREAKAAAKLHHTNIVPVFGVGDQNGIHFYAMQFIQGQGLDAVLKEVRRLREAVGSTNSIAAETNPDRQSPDEAGSSSSLTALAPSASWSETDAPYYAAVARIGVQAADALAYAHDHGVLHRDIKPSNLLLDTHGTLWVSDFGLAKTEELNALTDTGDFVGTLRYMAPERFSHGSDARSDLYSLGVTLYEMLALRPAFDERDRGRLIRQVAQEEPPSPRKFAPHVPRDLETIVLKAMAKNPAHRYQSATALTDDLRRFLADRPIYARRTRPWEHVRRWAMRNPALATTGSLGIGALVLGMLLTWWQWRRAEANFASMTAAFEQAKQSGEEAQAAAARAEASYRWAGGAVESMLEDVGQWARERPDDIQDARQRLLRRAAIMQEEFLERIGEAPGVEVDLVRTKLRTAMLKQELHDGTGAVEAYREAIAMVESQLLSHPGDRKLREHLAAALLHFSQLQIHSGAADSLAHQNRALEVYASLAADFPDDLDCSQNHARALNNQGVLLIAAGQDLKAEACLRKAIEVLNVQVTKTEGSRANECYSTLADSQLHLGMVLGRLKRPAEAIAALRVSIETCPRTGASPGSQNWCRHMGTAQALLGDACMKTGANTDGVEAYRQAVKEWQTLVNADPHVPKNRVSLANVQSNLVTCLWFHEESAAEVVRLAMEAVSHAAAALTVDPSNAGHIREYHRALGNRGNVAHRFKQHAVAAQAAEKMSTAPPLGQGEESFRAAVLLGTCAVLASEDATISESKRQELAEQYAARAIACLQTAIERGFQSAERFAQLDVPPLSDRPEFQKLLAEIKGKGKTGEM